MVNFTMSVQQVGRQAVGLSMAPQYVIGLEAPIPRQMPISGSSHGFIEVGQRSDDNNVDQLEKMIAAAEAELIAAIQAATNGLRARLAAQEGGVQ